MSVFRRKPTLANFPLLNLDFVSMSGLVGTPTGIKGSNFPNYPDLEDPQAWQNLLDSIDFYEIKKPDILFLFSHAASLGEVDPEIPYAEIKGALAVKMARIFRDVLDVNTGKKSWKDFPKDRNNYIALKLLSDEYKLVSYDPMLRSMKLAKRFHKTPKPFSALSVEDSVALRKKRSNTVPTPHPK